MVDRMRRAAAIAAVACVTGVGAAACGDGGVVGGGGSPAHAKATPAAAHHSAAKLLYVWRNFEETGIPDELTIYADGSLRYRYLLHTQMGIEPQRARLRPARMAALQALIRRVDVGRADASGVKPRRSGYRWVLRRGGRTGTAADGHLTGPLRTLLPQLSALMDRLQAASS
jgi:hypothetical protein